MWRGERRRPNFPFKPASESECAREEEFTHVFADITKDAQFRENREHVPIYYSCNFDSFGESPTLEQNRSPPSGGFCAVGKKHLDNAKRRRRRHMP